VKESTLGELVERWLARSAPRLRDARSRERQLRVWLEVLGPDRRPCDITLDDIDEYRARRFRQGFTGATINRHVAALRAVLNSAVRWRLIERNPIAGLEQEREGNRRTRWLTRDEVVRLLRSCRASRARQLAPLIVVLLTTSKRLGAVLELRWEDIDLNRRVAVFHATNTKTNQVEVACLNEDAVRALRELPRRREWVWTRADGERWRDPRTAFRVACRRAGLADVKGRFHCLRHTAATWMEMAGVPLTTIARVTGHRSRAALERYLHDSDRAARAAVEALRINGVKPPEPRT